MYLFAASGINPNLLTFIGSAINGVAAYLFAVASTARPDNYFRWAGFTVILAGIFDLTDGSVARVTGRAAIKRLPSSHPSAPASAALRRRQQFPLGAEQSAAARR